MGSGNRRRMGPLIALALLAAPPTLHAEDRAAAATVHLLASSQEGGYASAWLVETAEGVIAVDAPLVEKDALAARARLASLGKPLLAVLLTSPRPEHAAGAKGWSQGLAEPAPIVAGEAVAEALRAAPGAVAVDRVVKDRETVSFAKMRFTAHESGEGTAWVLLGKQPAAFAGDLIVRGSAPDLRQGGTRAWLERLDHAKRLFYGLRIFYPGHGGQTGFAALEEQRRYLLAVRAAVQEVAHGKPRLDEAARQKLIPRLSALRPGEPLGTLVGPGADAVAAELLAERAAPAR